MSPLELVDDRFGKLAEELRAAKPVAPPALRERVADLAEVEPAPPRWTFRKPSRRLVLVLLAAAVIGSFVAAGLTGHTGTRSRSAEGFQPSLPATQNLQEQHAGQTGSGRFPTALPAWESDSRYQAFKATPGRLQRYEATLRLRVKDVDALSDAAKRAMSMTRALGGYVGSVQYSTTKGKRGAAMLVLRVPVASVQAALAQLTGLGTILQQRTGILDVTKRAQTETRQIAKLERELRTATPERAAVIRLKLKTLRAKHARLVRSARLARIELGLTTPAKQAAAAPSRFDSTLDDAGAVLLRELEFLLYALVVVGPLLLLGGAALVTARSARRRSDRRLLERA